MIILKRKALVFVWACLFVHGSLYGLLSQYWRWGLRNKLKGGKLYKSSLWMHFVVMACNVSFTNFPDFISISVYLVLWRKINKSVAPVGNGVAEDPGAQQDPGAFAMEEIQHGNIFPAEPHLGEPPPIPQNEPGQNQPVKLEHICTIAWLANFEYFHPFVMLQIPNLIRALRWHAFTSLLDMTMLLLLLVPDLFLRIVLVQNLALVFTFWIPLVGMKKCFKEMDNMMDTFCILVC